MKMAGTLQVRRSRGAFSGVLLVLLGLWGGLIPLVGPYLHYAFRPDRAWTITSGRIWLEFLPAAATVVGGLVMLASKMRPWAMFGATLAALGGGWFTFGSVISRLWMHAPPRAGAPIGGTVARAIEQLGFFAGLGAVIICIAAVALGRLSVISVRDAAGVSSRSVPVPAVSQPAPTTASRPVATSTSTPRRAPMASLVRIASRKNSASAPTSGNGDSDTSDTSDTSARQKIGTGG
jgi:hypothetical protein